MIKTLLKELKQYKKESILTPFCMVLEVIFETIIPVCLGLIVDNGIEAEGGTDMKYIFMMGALITTFVSAFINRL